MSQDATANGPGRRKRHFTTKRRRKASAQGARGFRSTERVPHEVAVALVFVVQKNCQRPIHHTGISSSSPFLVYTAASFHPRICTPGIFPPSYRTSTQAPIAIRTTLPLVSRFLSFGFLLFLFIYTPQASANCISTPFSRIPTQASEYIDG